MKKTAIYTLLVLGILFLASSACTRPPADTGDPDPDKKDEVAIPDETQNGNGESASLGGDTSIGDAVTSEDGTTLTETPVETPAEDGAALNPDDIFGHYASWPPASVTAEEIAYMKGLVVIFETSKGNIKVRLFAEQAPLHSANCVKLVQDGFYDGSPFHRVIEDFMTQGGGRPDGSDAGYVIPEEISLPHVAGSMCAARTDNPQKNSSGSQFYFVHSDTSANYLDGNYTVYGQIIEGIDINLAITKNWSKGGGPIPDIEPDEIIKAWVEVE